jgi:hypothetical protein
MRAGSTIVERNKTGARLFAGVESNRAAKSMKLQSFAILRSMIRNLQCRTNKRGLICPDVNTVIGRSAIKQQKLQETFRKPEMEYRRDNKRGLDFTFVCLKQHIQTFKINQNKSWNPFGGSDGGDRNRGKVGKTD